MTFQGILNAVEMDVQPGFADIKAWPKISTFAPPAPVILLALSKALWKFLHDTGHPQVKGTKVDCVKWSSNEINLYFLVIKFVLLYRNYLRNSLP